MRALAGPNGGETFGGVSRDLVLVLVLPAERDPRFSLFSERLAKISLRSENENEDEDEDDNFAGAAIRPKVAALR